MNRNKRSVLWGAAAAGALFVVVAGSAEPAAAQQQAGARADEATEAGREHIVRRGDTLWDLAGFYLRDPFSWPSIFEVNRSVVEDPHWIYPDERLLIPPVSPASDGRPALRARPMASGLRAPQAYARTRFYSPPPEPLPSRMEVEEERASTATAVKPGEFHAAPWLDRPERLPALGRLARVVAAGILDDLATGAVHPYSEVVIGYAGAARPEIGDRLLLVRVGRRIDDWGRIIEPAAVLRVSALHAETMTAEVVQQFSPVDEGAIALPYEPFTVPAGVEPQPIEGGPTGRIISFAVEQPLPSVSDHAFLDLSAAEGVQVGDEFVAMLPERRVEVDGRRALPAEPVARMRVVRLGPTTATARVIGLYHPVLEDGLPVTLVRKMP